MSTTDSKILSRIPQYLVEESNASTNSELTEKIKPNSISLTTSLIDKVISELNEYNYWKDFDKYSPEFRLPEIFGKTIEVFAVDEPELLKGFFRFKGTQSDLDYMLRTAGYSINIYDSKYFLANGFTDILRRERFATVYANLLLQLPNDEDYESALESIFFQERVWKTEGRVATRFVNNLNPYLVINIDRLDSYANFFNLLPYSPNQDEIDLLNELIDTWLEAQTQDFDEIDCYLGADIRIDLDAPNIRRLLNLTGLTKFLVSIIEYRLSLFAKLRDIVSLYYLKDTFTISTDLIQFTSDFNIEKYFIENIEPIEYYFSSEYSVSNAPEYMSRPGIIANSIGIDFTNPDIYESSFNEILSFSSFNNNFFESILFIDYSKLELSILQVATYNSPITIVYSLILENISLSETLSSHYEYYNTDIQLNSVNEYTLLSLDDNPFLAEKFNATSSLWETI